MPQSRSMSAVEAVANVAVGLLVAIATQVVVFPWFGIQPLPLVYHFQIGLVFTMISLIRSYVLRRIFNG